MKTASVRELRSRTAELIDSDEPVIVTRNGKHAALLYPLHDPDKVPLEIRRELFREITAKIGKQLGPGVPKKRSRVTSPPIKSIAADANT
jgi:antitoxin (DNA-binding transcriptional repressor) of toxin-antitoxin stability system